MAKTEKVMWVRRGFNSSVSIREEISFMIKRISVDTYDIHNGGQNPLCFPLVPWAPHHCPTSRLCQSWQKSHSSFFIGSCPLAPWAKKKKNSCLKSEILFFIYFVTVDFIYKFFTGLLKSLVFETCLIEIIWPMSSVHNTFAVSLVKIGLGYYFSDSASLKGNLTGCSNLAGINHE